MSAKTYLYLNKNCFKSQTIEVLLQFFNCKYEVVYFEDQNEENKKKIIQQSLTGAVPLLQNEDFFLSGTPTIIKYFMNSNQDVKNSLTKDDDNESNLLVEMWVNYVKDNIWIILEATNTGNEDIKNEAKKDLLNVLNNLNNHLTFKTFMVGSSITLADLYLCSSLRRAYDLILDVEDIKKYNNVTRLLKLVSNLKQLKTVFGDLKLK